MSTALYLKHYDYLLDDPDIFQVFFPGTHRSTQESKHNDVIVIFDDTEKMPNVKVEKMLYQLVNVLAQNGRNFGTNVICILHQLNKGLQSIT
jgi:hypothetical protein